jgi:ribose 5-phosphate isomerase B
MTIYLATDHAGFALKEKIKSYLLSEKYTVEDCGAYAFDKHDDYPDFIFKAAKVVSKSPQDRAIIFGGSGQGEAMLANKFHNVRAALFYGPRITQSAVDVNGTSSTDAFEIVRLTRVHNNANVLSLGARLITEEEAMQAVKIFLSTEFSHDPRHVRRIEKMEHL